MMAGEASADKMATGMPAVSGLLRRRLRTSSPCSPGRCRSRRIRSGMSWVASSRPAGPEMAYCSRMLGLVFTNRTTTSMFAGLSSMYRTRIAVPLGSSGTICCGIGPGPRSEGSAMSGARGRITVKTDPSPGVLAAVRVPLTGSAAARARVHPGPGAPVGGVRGAEPLERVEDALQISGRYSRPGIGDRQADLAGARHLAGEGDGSADAVVLDRVGDQVDQDLAESQPVAVNRQAGPRAVLADRDRAV